MVSYSYPFAQVLGISSSFWLAGEIFTYSYGAVPALLEGTSASQSLAARQWARLYHRGHAVGPPLAALGAGAFTWLALKSDNMLYLGAAALDISIVPWTLLFMVKTNQGIFELAETIEEKSSQGDSQLTPLLNKWATLNTIRSFLPFAGGVLGLLAALT